MTHDRILKKRILNDTIMCVGDEMKYNRVLKIKNTKMILLYWESKVTGGQKSL